MPRRILFAFFLCTLLCGATLSAQDFAFGGGGGGEKRVQASLVADTNAIVPGKPFTVGLLQKIDPNWHTYWQYPGDSGLPTKIQWNLPPGFKAGEIQWPLPHKEVDEGDLVTYVYPDEVLLMVTITPPEKIDAKEITIEAKASWLVCEKICVPGKADVSVKLPVAAQATADNADLFKKYRALVPKPIANEFYYYLDSKPDTYVFKFGEDPKAAGKNWQNHIDREPPADFDFFPLPPSGVMLEHSQITKGKQPGVSIKVDSGDPAQISGVLVYEKDGKRSALFIPSQTSAPPSAPASSVNTGTISAPPASTSSLVHYLILGFLGGMLLNIMPCVLPVITLKIYGFINQAGQSRARTFQLGLAYCAGVFAWFLGLAALIVAFGLNWSFQFQNKGFVFGMLVICLIFGLNLLGLFEVVLPTGLNTKMFALASKDGLGGSFVHGVFTTLMGSACTAPLLGPAIGFALSQPPLIIFAFFGTIAAGMAFPYFLLTANPAWMRFLPKPGIWMVRVKQVMGVLVLATAVWFGTVLFSQVAVKREAFGPTLESALKSGRIVFVDYTADWCINCKYNEKVVIKSAPVQEAFKNDNVLFVTADWTNGDEDITKLLKQYGRAGVPVYVIYPAGSDKPMVLPELLTQEIVLNGLKQAKDKSSVN